MEYFLPLLILAGLVFLGFAFPKSKFVHFLLLIFIFSLYTLSYDEYDRLVYMREYENVSTSIGSDYELLYVWLMSICSKFGLTFQQFRYVTALITLSGLEYAAIKFSPKINHVWSLYLIYSSLFDATLIRTSLSMGFIAVFLVTLIYSKEFKDYVLSFVLVLIASLIHSSSWIYSIFIPVWFYINKKSDTKKFATLIIVMSIAVIVGASFLFSLYSHLIIREYTTEKYTIANAGTYGDILYNVIKYVFVISPVLLLRRFTPTSKKPLHDFESNILGINLLFMIILVPQYYVSLLSRLFKVLVFFNYIYITRIENLYKNANNRLLICTFGIVYSIIMFFFHIYNSSTIIEFVIDMHFKTNEILTFSFLE